MKKTWRDKLKTEEILKLFEQAKALSPEYNILCHPKTYSEAQKLVSGFIEFFIRDAKVIWSTNDKGHRRVCTFYTDTKEQGAFLQGLDPENDWDETASQFFRIELQTLLNEMSFAEMKFDSQLFLKRTLEQAQKILKISDLDIQFVKKQD